MEQSLLCPIAQMQVSSGITGGCVLFSLIDALMKAFEALDQNYCPDYSDADL